MSVINIIYEKDVIQKILKHLDLWEQDMPPPAEEGYIYEPYDDGYTLTLTLIFCQEKKVEFVL